MSALHAFFYLRMAEPMPKDAPDSWFLQPDPTANLTDRVDRFETQVRALMVDLADLDDEDAFQTAFYDRAKAAFGEQGDQIKAFFQMLYRLMFDQPQGPRWGKFVALTGKEQFMAALAQRLEDPMTPPPLPERDYTPASSIFSRTHTLRPSPTFQRQAALS